MAMRLQQQLNSPRGTVVFAAAVGVLCAVSAGCPGGSQNNSARQGGMGLGRRTDQSQALLATAIRQLGDLPSFVQTDLAPPEVVLDSRTSGDGKDVLAVLDRAPKVDEDLRLFNYLKVTTGNGRFKALNVQTGDIVKYFIDVDTEAVASEAKIFGNRSGQFDPNDPDAPAAGSEEQWNAGFVREKAIDFPVGQVVDNDTLIVAQPFPIAIEFPAKIEIWRYSDERMLEINHRLARYTNRGVPPLAWEPSPDEHVLIQILDRLNPWSRQTAEDGTGQVDPLLETLPEALRSAEVLQPYASAEAIGRPAFSLHDARILQQAVWLRDISEWARGESFDPVKRAEALFDWTVRHIQLEDVEDEPPRFPWQTLLYGRGTAEQRAWIFALLCRQQRMDVVMLTIPPAGEEDNAGEDGGTRFWLAALVHDGQLYLFDPRLGLPIRGSGADEVATLAQVRENPELLAALTVDDMPYPVTAADAARAVVNVVASPLEITDRAKRLQAQLSGADRLILAVDASAVAEEVRPLANGGDVRLWEGPYRTLLALLELAQSDDLASKTKRYEEAFLYRPFAWRPRLFKARLLHFQGKKETRKDPRRTGWEEVIDSHKEAGQLYTHRLVRPPNRTLATVTSDDKRAIYETAKRDASYWMGLLSYDDGRYEPAAIDWFQRHTLEANPDGPWTQGARYNLARTYEQLGRFDEAIALYEADGSPQRHGNRLRARLLAERLAESGDAEDGGDTP